MSAGLPLAEFTALLARQLAESASVAERRQRDEFVALAAEVDGSPESFIDRVIGGTVEERKTCVGQYIGNVITPLLTGGRKPNVAGNDDALFRLDDTGLGRLIEHFGDSVREAIDRTTEGGKWVLERTKLEEMILARLRREAEARYRDIRARLAMGVPKTQISGGTLTAKVLLLDDGNGSMTARMASPEIAKESAAAISTLTVDFSVGSFPAFE
jgi:hypothetical protein